MNNILEVNNLELSFFTYAGIVHAVRNISFTVEKGKTTAIVGESGCGKSVTAKSIMGLKQIASNIGLDSQIMYEGKNVLQYTEKEWMEFRGKECAMIFQDALVALNPTMKVGKQIMENLKNHNGGLEKQEIFNHAIEMLKMVEIPDPELCMKKYPHELSGGMRQRVMIAMMLITHPKLLIADEPTTALDVTIQAQIMKLLEDLQKKFQMTIILITHDLGLVADVADKIIIMYAGKIVEQGTCEEIFYYPTHPYTWALLNAVPHIERERKQKLQMIEGNVPNMIQEPKGCSFCNRCPYSMKICEIQEPKSVFITESHEVCCWLMDKRADISKVPFKVRRTYE